MKLLAVFSAFFFLLSAGSFAQNAATSDYIKYSSGEILPIVFVKKDDRFVYFKKHDFTNGPILKLPLANFELVVDDGIQVWPIKENEVESIETAVAIEEEIIALDSNKLEASMLAEAMKQFALGRSDAKSFYRPKKAFWVGYVGGLFAPLSLGPAGVYAFLAPSQKGILSSGGINPNIDKLIPISNSYSADYESGYLKTARKKKASKVALGFASGIGTILFLILTSNQEE